MKYRVPKVAIDNLRELALYSDECWIANTVDDELYDLLMQGLDDWPFPSTRVAGYEDVVIRRMYFFFMAEMLKTPWESKPTVTVKKYQLHKPVPAHVAAMANAVIHQLDTGDIDRQAVRVVCEWVSIQRKTELCQG